MIYIYIYKYINIYIYLTSYMCSNLPKHNTKTKKEASSSANQMYSLLSSIGQNVYNIS